MRYEFISEHWADECQHLSAAKVLKIFILWYDSYKLLYFFMKLTAHTLGCCNLYKSYFAEYEI